MLQINGVTKKIGNRVIVDDLTLTVHAGEVYGFLGPNGAGKTTTIRLIVGLMRMTSGTILINNHNIHSDFAEAIRHVGAVVENPEFYKYLTGYQNLLHFARSIPGVDNQRITEVVKLVRLEERIHEKVKKYSLGMRQRLGIAQALLRKPSLLVLDEPTNGLDPAGIREMRDYLRELAHKEGTAIFVSSHLLAEMEMMCDKVAIIQQGKLVNVSTIQELSKTAGKMKIVFEVAEREAAYRAVLEWLLQHAEDGNVSGQNRMLDDGIEVSLDHDQVPYVNEHLVQAGIKVYGIRKQHSNLEDYFLQLTGGQSIV